MTEASPNPANTPARRLGPFGHGGVRVAVLTGAGGLFALAVVALTLPMDRLEQSSPVVVDRSGAWVRALPVRGGRWRLRADLQHTDPIFVARLVALEDRGFWLHPGVDPLALGRAALSDLTAGKIRSGGSTLAMQLARRLDPHPRTLRAKALEAVRALALCARLGKSGTLQAYLTLAPYGGDLEGVRAASLAYFGHEPDQLTDAEQALLIALPQSPETRRPDRHPEAAKRARHQILAKFVAKGLITTSAAQEADRTALPRRRGFPVRVWAASGDVARSAQASTLASAPTVHATFDLALQARLESLAAHTAASQGDRSSASIIVVHIADRSVRALVSSAGAGRDGAWIDETRAFRSPGSALKPFLYGFAFEQGLAAPETRLTDAPTAYDGYEPENFDRSFHGEVSAREALANSLNLPAVALLQRLGPAAFESRLRGAGVDIRTPKDAIAAPGLALALGGDGIRLRDMAVLYAALGDGGIAKPLAFTEDEPTHVAHEAGRRLMSEEAARQVLNILREAPPPDGRSATGTTSNAPQFAFKTGTSYSFRDAVAAGVGQGWCVLVWTGRPDGGSRPGLTGREAALPLLFQVFDSLAGAPGRPLPRDPASAPSALQSEPGAVHGPRVLFPPEGAVLYAEGFGPKSQGIALDARGQGVFWYVEGQKLARGATDGAAIWRPASAGFYILQAIDAAGRTTRVRVQVRSEH